MYLEISCSRYTTVVDILFKILHKTPNKVNMSVCLSVCLSVQQCILKLSHPLQVYFYTLPCDSSIGQG